MNTENTWTGRAPGRVNLIGEHVDYMGGLVLPCAIDLHTTVTGKPAEDWEVISHVPGGLPYVRAIAERLGAGPQRVEVESSVSAGAGLSSSAALLVAVCSGLAPDLDGAEAAVLCQESEHAATGVMVGVMDHFASALGRAGTALLLDCRELRWSYVSFPEEVVIAVLDSGVRRNLAETPYNERRREAEAGVPRRKRHVESEIARVRAFAEAMAAGNLESMGHLLRESHLSLRDDFEVSTPVVDAIVERAWQAPGCIGARMMGAGFGGSILALVRAGKERDFEAALGRPAIFCRTADGAYAHAGA
jgi:galactokinase